MLVCGNFLSNHLLFMRCYIIPTIAIFLSFSCFNTSLKENNKACSSNQSTQSSFECDYANCKARTNILFRQYRTKPDSTRKQTLLNNIRDSLFVCWYGTEWDFNGITEEPGRGKIACGYFVTTILRDMGVAVNRIKHAQCASEEMIRAVCIKNSIRRFSNEGISSFIEKIKLDGIGLYIVGLDFHTGFILNDGEDIYFLHANYTGKKVVEKEIAMMSSVLSTSEYKVIGRVI